jgi:hypothetical protein
VVKMKGIIGFAGLHVSMTITRQLIFSKSWKDDVTERSIKFQCYPFGTLEEYLNDGF